MSKLPLSDVVILDFSWAVSGTQGTRLLADWGAQVYRMEWPQSLDLMRAAGSRGAATPEEYYEAGGTIFYDINASKYGVTLNMKSEQGKALFVEMLKKADVVYENFSPSAMASWGFDYAKMREINPRIIYLSLSGFGHTESPQKYYASYGPAAQALSGLTHSSGLPGEEPAGWGFSYMDNSAGYISAMALLMAIHERELSGVGQHLDLSQVEQGIAMTGAAFLDYSVNERGSRRPGFPPGNRATWPGHPVTSSYRADPVSAPHNAYRTKGGTALTKDDPDNNWCAITAFNDAQWQALARVVGGPDLIADPRFATLQGRLENQVALDEIIERWTLQRDKYEAMHTLQAVGVPAGAVQSSKNRIEDDPQLRERDVHVMGEGHPIWGPRLAHQVPVHMSKSQPRHRHIAPLIGEHNEYALGKLLGYSPEQVRALVDDGTLWPVGRPKPHWVKGLAESDAPLRQAGE